MKKVFIVQGYYNSDGISWSTYHDTMEEAQKAFDEDRKSDYKTPTHVAEGWVKIKKI